MTVMKIPPYQTNAAEGSAPAAVSSVQGKTATATGVASDQVQLSQNYLDLANAQKSISGTDQVRNDRIQQIKSQIESGSYRVNAGETAGRMLDEIM